MIKSFVICLLLLTSTVQASYCSGKNWRETYLFYTFTIDALNVQIDRYNMLLNKSNLSENIPDEAQYLALHRAIEELDQLSIDVEALRPELNKVKQFWLLISEHCEMDDELDYYDKALENSRGADIGRREVNDLLVRIEHLRRRFFELLEYIRADESLFNS